MTRCLCPHVRAGSCEWLNCLSDFFHDQQTAKEPSACFAFSRWSACVHSEKEQVKPRVFLFFILPPKKRPGSGSPSAGGNPGDDVFGRACGTVSVLRPFWSVRPSVCRWHSFPLISVVQFFPSLQQTFLPFSSFFSTWLQVLASILGALGALHTSQTINWVAALNQTIGSKRPNQNGPSAKKNRCTKCLQLFYSSATKCSWLSFLNEIGVVQFFLHFSILMRRVFSLVKNETAHFKMPPARCVLDAQHTNVIRFITSFRSVATWLSLNGGCWSSSLFIWREFRFEKWNLEDIRFFGENVKISSTHPPFPFCCGSWRGCGSWKGNLRLRKRRLFWQHDDVVGELIRSRERKSSAA